MITRFMLLMIFLTNLLTIILTVLACKFVTKNLVFDMDLVRDQYLKDARMYYMRGCEDGTDYPPEYRQSGPGWNDHSPAIYCGELKDGQEEAFLHSMFNIGRVRRE